MMLATLLAFSVSGRCEQPSLELLEHLGEWQDDEQAILSLDRSEQSQPEAPASPQPIAPSQVNRHD